MGVTICRDCGRDVSDELSACPHCGRPSAAVPPSTGLPTVAVVLLGMMVCVALVGIGASIAIPAFVGMNMKAKRAEVPANVDGIKTAQLAYDAAFDTFVHIPEPWPRPVGALGRSQVRWDPGSDFDTLGWAPDGQVRGTYWVVVHGDDFEVHGMIDADGDGQPAHYMATRDTNTRLLTPDGVI